MNIIDGKEVSSLIKRMISEKVAEDIKNGKSAPTLACILVGDDPASKIYVKNKEKACALCGINSIIKTMPSNATQDEVGKTIHKLNDDPNVSAILLQLPLPKHLDENYLVNQILPSKDADCLTELNLGKLFSNKHQIAPCTSTGIIDLLDHYNIDIEGKKAVVVGRSLLVGKSVANLLEQRNATVTLCHSKTQDLKEETSKADILVVAIGRPKFITADMVKNGAVVVDVGINRVDGKVAGDVDFEAVKDKVSYITPVPGGVGPMTVAELMKNTTILHNGL